MKNILICWIGLTDIRASKNEESAGLGPIAQAVAARGFSEIVLISNLLSEVNAAYVTWLNQLTDASISLHEKKLTGPTRFGEIYEAAVGVVLETRKRHGKDIALTFHISPGTPAMAAVWIILAKTRFPAELIESSPHAGVVTASVPFDISAEFIPDLLRQTDQKLSYLSSGLPPDAPAFSDIIHRSSVMERIIIKAQHVALRSVPVLIEGESGTGKELLARAIHKASPRKDNAFVAVNCGAIPSELVESEFFGHEKGAFTGAHQARTGYFEAADGGTLFLDEIGELPLPMQVKFLRVLQEGEVVRVGSTRPIPIDVRIIAATHRSLSEDIQTGHFRPDLFYRLAVAILKLPPIRERSGDMGLLIDALMEQINRESKSEPGYRHKKLSVSAKNIMLQQSWPGNVRELLNTLRRSALWSEGETIQSEDAREALIQPQSSSQNDLMNRPLGSEFSLQELIQTLARHYIQRALNETHGNKTQAAKQIGFSSYQTLTNWMKKYGLE